MLYYSGLYGQLGLGTNSKQTFPQLVQNLKKEKVYLICCGSFETVRINLSLVHKVVTVVLNPLNPNIKIQFLLSCPNTFIIAVVGRSCENFKRIHLG